jgi:DNA modification methylase
LNQGDYQDERLTILGGDCLDRLRSLPAESVQCCVTSPPYFGLRDYGVDGQIGLEQTPEEFIAKLVDVFREVRRVLKSDGVLWVNIGDSYAGSGRGNNPNGKQGTNKGTSFDPTNSGYVPDGCKPKDLIGIPWMLAFALRADGWYLRQDIIWHKPNPMPESVTDRCTKSHEYIFLLSKSSRYFYDAEAVREPIKDASIARLIQNVEDQKGSDRIPGKTNGTMKAVKFGGNNPCPDTRLQSGKEWSPKMAGGGSKVSGHSGYFDKDGNPLCGVMANKKSVWSVTTRGYKEAHFATYPPELIKPCILAGSRPGDVVLDPFGGSGTTGKVALELGRSAILCELNPDYIKLIKKRCQVNLPLDFGRVA